MKKGFTLVELLAVIVILAVIAIIAIPIITNVIDNAKKGALKDSAYGILDSAEMYLAKNINKGIDDTMEFTCNNGKCLSGTEEINYKGKIESGKVRIYTDSKIELCVSDNKSSALKTVTGKKVEVVSGTCDYGELNYGVTALVSKTALDEANKKYNDLRDGIIEKLENNAITSSSTDEEIISSINTGGYVGMFNISGAINTTVTPVPVTYFNPDYVTSNNNSITINKSGKYRLIARAGHSPYDSTNTSNMYVYLDNTQIGYTGQNYYKEVMLNYEFTVGDNETKIINATIKSDGTMTGNRFGTLVIIKE